MGSILLLISFVIFLWFIYRNRKFSIFKNYGIPGPTPYILFGNSFDLYLKGPFRCHKEWIQKYGRIFGYFYGVRPVLVVTDPLIIKNIFIKDFQKFTNKEPFNPLQKYKKNDKRTKSILDLEGKAWKEIRNVLSPSFTASKMKQIGNTMNSSIEDILKAMREMASKYEDTEIHQVYQRLTLDVITRSAFSIRTDVQSNHDSNFMRAVLLLVNTPYRDILTFIGLCFPALQNVCLEIQNYIMIFLNRGLNPAILLVEEIKKVISLRKDHSDAKKCDIMQLMIDANIKDDKLAEISEDKIEQSGQRSHQNLTEITARGTRSMTENEIIASSMAVMLAGYETTSTFLTYVTYILCKHPDIQERLFEEVDHLIQNGGNLNYSTVLKLPYLDRVMSECLRMYPPVPLFTNRYALEEVQYDSITIPKGVLVQAPVYIMHHDPEFWDDPETFNPERFDKNPNSDGIIYLPFGAGPRSCLGMRFAQLEGKLALAHLVHNFKFKISERQPESLEIGIRLRTQCPMSGVRVKLECRNIKSSE